MLSAVFKFKLPSIGSVCALKDFTRSFAIQRSRSVNMFPFLDLNLVLRFLIFEEFEPLGNKSLRVLTQKTLFLVSLATAKRVGELQVLSSKVPSLGEDLVLSYLQSFIAKIESISNPITRSFSLKSLSDLAGDLSEDLLLCPD